MGRRQAALAALADHAPSTEQEAEHLAALRAFAERKDQPFDRADPEGHLVASGLVASPALDRIILLHHRQLDLWLQCGGHAEPGDGGPRPVALREAREETGLEAIEPHPAWPRLLDVDVHEIPATEAMPTHRHLDLRFLLVADPEATLTAPASEAKAIGWFDLEEARDMDLDAGLARLVGKVEALGRGTYRQVRYLGER